MAENHFFNYSFSTERPNTEDCNNSGRGFSIPSANLAQIDDSGLHKETLKHTQHQKEDSCTNRQSYSELQHFPDVKPAINQEDELSVSPFETKLILLPGYSKELLRSSNSYSVYFSSEKSYTADYNYGGNFHNISENLTAIDGSQLLSGNVKDSLLQTVENSNKHIAIEHQLSLNVTQASKQEDKPNSVSLFGTKLIFDPGCSKESDVERSTDNHFLCFETEKNKTLNICEGRDINNISDKTELDSRRLCKGNLTDHLHKNVVVKQLLKLESEKISTSINESKQTLEPDCSKESKDGPSNRQSTWKCSLTIKSETEDGNTKHSEYEQDESSEGHKIEDEGCGEKAEENDEGAYHLAEVSYGEEDDEDVPPAGSSSSPGKRKRKSMDRNSTKKKKRQIDKIPSKPEEDNPIRRDENKFLCVYCGYTCKRSASLKEHICRKHTGEKNYACAECPRRFVKSHELKNHMRQHTGEKPYACTLCDYKSAHARSLVDHMCIHTGQMPYKCSTDGCEYKCANPSTLKKHIRTHTGDLPFPCEQCNYKAMHAGHLRDHMRTHTGEKPFTCNFCDFSCARSSYMKQHVRVHTQEKPYACTICDYKCNQSKVLKEHIRIHTNEKPYACSLCDYKCAQNSTLKQHLLSHSGDKPHTCRYCDTKFARQEHLKSHELIHTGEKPFQCELCSYRCRKSYNLKSHMRVHTGEKPYACILCDFKCSQPKSLQNHVSNIHGDKLCSSLTVDQF